MRTLHYITYASGAEDLNYMNFVHTAFASGTEDLASANFVLSFFLGGRGVEGGGRRAALPLLNLRAAGANR